jgi:hypothetical protein
VPIVRAPFIASFLLPVPEASQPAVEIWFGILIEKRPFVIYRVLISLDTSLMNPGAFH